MFGNRDKLGRLSLHKSSAFGPWVDVGTVRLVGVTSIENMLVLPLQARMHDSSRPGRYLYRVRWTGRGREGVWIELGDKEAGELGVDWEQHGGQITIFDTLWQVYLNHRFR